MNRLSLAAVSCAAFAVALSGCAQRDTTIRNVVPSRVFTPTQNAPATDATLTLHRDLGLYGGGCSARVLMDGRLLAQLEQGEQISLPVPAGSHQLKLRWFGACATADQELQTSLPNGGQATYDIAADGRSMRPQGKS